MIEKNLGKKETSGEEIFEENICRETCGEKVFEENICREPSGEKLFEAYLQINV